MAEVATKKSINVVSNNKNGEVCGVQSNNGLIDLENITTNNSQLISLCDDDLLLSNNAKNDLNAEDKSLQELIESELALRISTTQEDEQVEVTENEEATPEQPEITKIILEPRQDPLDINSEFIIAEMDHYNVIDDPYAHQNGHSFPDSKSKDNSESPALLVDSDEGKQAGVDEEEAEVYFNQSEVDSTTVKEQTESNIGQSTDKIHKKGTSDLEESEVSAIDRSFGIPNDESRLGDANADSIRNVNTMDDADQVHFQKEVTSSDTATLSEKYLQEEEISQTNVSTDNVDFVQVENQGQVEDFFEKIADPSKTTDLLDTWPNPEVPGDSQLIGQFSDNFDGTIEQIHTTTQVETKVGNSDKQHDILNQESQNLVDLSNEATATDKNLISVSQDSEVGKDVHIRNSSVQSQGEANNEFERLCENVQDLADQLPGTEPCPEEDQDSDFVFVTKHSRQEKEQDWVEAKSTDSVSQDTVNDPESIQKSVETSEPEHGQPVNRSDIPKEVEKAVTNEDHCQEVTSSSAEILPGSSESQRQKVNSEEITSTQGFIESERQNVHQRMQQRLEEVLQEAEVVLQETHQEKNNGKGVELEEAEEDHDSSQVKKTLLESETEFSTVIETTAIEIVETTEKTISQGEHTVRVFSESKYSDQCFFEQPSEGQDFESWTTVEEATIVKPEVKENQDAEVKEQIATDTNHLDELTEADRQQLAPLAIPDDETFDVSNQCDLDTEKREEVTNTVVTSSSTSTKTKSKKKKIEGVANSDASPTLTPRTKKTKKSKKNDPEKENISVNGNLDDSSMHTRSSQTSPERIDLPGEDDLSNVNVKSLTQSYVSETNRLEQEKGSKEVIATGVSIKQLCRSFGDLSNMSDGEQNTFGQEDHDMDSDERAATTTLEARRYQTRHSVPGSELQSVFLAAKGSLMSNSSYSTKAKSMGDLRLFDQQQSDLTKDATIFKGVSVKALRASYCSLANLTFVGKEKDFVNASAMREKSSFNKFDALSKKTVLHVRSVDAGKVQQQLNAVGQNGEANPNCRSCGKVVFQMEQTKAEGSVWHKNCFRCVQCSKQLSVDNYQSHEGTLYCKAHFKELFQPKPVEESDQPVRPRKPEMIIRENQPKELPPDVARASDKPDLGLEELSALNVKSRFQVFEKATTDISDIDRSPSQVAVKRSPSILSKLAKFQAKGMDIGVADESLNGIPYEESSESEEEEEDEEEVDTEIVKAKRATRERPMSFSKMDDMKNRWECTSQQGRRESQREARKEEIAGIRSRLFMGKQGKMKEMYQQAVAESERITKTNAVEEIQNATHTRSIKERFERGEPIAASDDEGDNSKPKQEKPDEEVIAAGISKKSRSLFLELDATAAKTGRPVTPVTPKTPADQPRRARDMESPEREIYRDPEVIRAEDRAEKVVHSDTARKMLSIFRQMEENASKEDLPDGPKPLKRFTPPPEDKFAKPTASESEDEEDEEGEESEGEESGEERDPNYVRASDKVEDEFLKQAQNAARAKTLRAKFEHWETTDGKVTNHNVAEMEIAQGAGEQSSIESASSLRARFESLGSQSTESLRTPKVKVNRFVEIHTNCTDVCEICEKKVYPLEKVETNNKIFHKQCFRCLQCNCILRMDTFTLNSGKLYCIPHFKQLFITRGNYDEGFGINPHKNKWANSGSAAPPLTPTTQTPITVSNGDL